MTATEMNPLSFKLRRANCVSFLLLATAAIQCDLSPAQEAKAPAATKQAVERILDRTPFDRVILNQAGGGDTLEVLPLDLPKRPLEAVPTTGAFRVRLLSQPTEEFELSWSNVAAVRTFEQVLLDEANRLTAAGKFDEAYDYFARLNAEARSTPKLDESICNYLQQNAMAVYQARQPDRALALLLTLYERNPAYPNLPAAVEKIAGEKIQGYLRDGDFASARRVLDLWQKKFENVATQSAAAWQQRFESAAGNQLGEANQLLARKDYISARRAVGRALVIWPQLPAAQQLLARIEREYRFVTVGVFEATPLEPKRRIDDWASIRASTLTERLLAEETDFGADGGVYTCAFGKWSLDETGRILTFQIDPTNSAGVTADALSRYILSLAAPNNTGSRGDLTSLLSSVSIESGSAVVLHLNRSHVRPESLLQVQPPTNSTPPFTIAEYSPEQVVFASRLATATGAGPQAIVEHQQPDDDSAVAALIAGDIDILDRVPPWHLERIRAAANIKVDRYKLPTVHVLIPNFKRPLLERREFRRAVCFGIDRKTIVNRVLLGGKTEAGFEVVSGPFPVGTSLNDPIRYAYNAQVVPRAFEPRLASILATIAWANVQRPPAKDNKPAENGESPPPEPASSNIPELTLAHPSDPVARLTCQAIQTQLTRAGIPIKLVEFTAEELSDGKVDCDLRYAELAVWEPLADAETILGQQGLAGELRSSYLDSALRELATAASWKDVRTRMSLLHEIASHELPVIPLWQTVNFFAYRKSLRGIGDSPMTLYQNASQWSSEPRANVAQTRAAQPK